MKRRGRPLVLALALGGSFAPAVAADDAARLAALQTQVDQLAAANAGLQAQLADVAQQLAILARKQELGAEQAAEALPGTPVIALGERGLSIRSRAGDNEVALGST